VYVFQPGDEHAQLIAVEKALQQDCAIAAIGGNIIVADLDGAAVFSRTVIRVSPLRLPRLREVWTSPWNRSSDLPCAAKCDT
jgi:hypothetical protein